MATAQSSYGYNAIPTLHRDAKQAVKHRELREKLMITGTIPSNTNPLRNTAASAGTISESDRFQKDAPGYLHQEKLNRLDHDAHRVEVKRQMREARAADAHAKNVASEDKWIRESQLLAGSTMRGRESVGYSLISGQYTNPAEAATQRSREARMAAAVNNRTMQLTRRSNSSGYNIITGEPRQ